MDAATRGVALRVALWVAWGCRPGSAWSVLPEHSARVEESSITYRVDASFCAHVLPRFYEDRILSLHGFDCASVRASVRAGFDVWQHNARVSFYETEGPAQVVVEGRALGATSQSLAQVSWSGDAATRLTIGTDACWYVDGAFCHAFGRHADLVQGLLAGTWVAALSAVAWLVCRPVAPYGGTVRLLAWALLIAPPLVYWGALAPCLQCHDFVTAVAHEVGHVLGLGHPDAAVTATATRCGCGNATVAPCARRVEAYPIMHSVAHARGRACLERDDADGARTLHGGNCSAPVWCHAEASYAGFARFAVALLYALAAAWLAVSGRVCAWRWWQARRLHTEPLPPLPPLPPPRGPRRR